MDIILKGFDSKNNPIELSNILWYEHFIGKFGFEETFTIALSKDVPFSLTKVVVTKENKKESECFVDSIEIDANKNGIFYIIKLKNIVCRLLENQVKPTIHKTFNLEKLLRRYTKNLNISCKIPNAFNIEIENFYVDIGMTAFDIIFFFFQITFKRYIFLNENKQLTFSFFPTTQLYFGNYLKNSLNPINGIKYNSIRIVDDRSKLISDAFLKIVYENNESDFLNLTQENSYAIDCNIKRTKYSTVPQMWQVLPKNGAEFIVQKQNKKRFSYEIITFEKVDISPGMIGKIKEIIDNKDVVAVAVLEKISQKGRKTKILFKNNNL